MYVGRVALEWDNVIRVWVTDELDILPEKDRDAWVNADGQNDEYIRGVYLRFGLRAEFSERTTSTGDPVDLENALIAGKVVRFFPCYDVDSGISYIVKGDSAAGNPINFRRGLYRPSADVRLVTRDRLSGIPTWMRTQRTR
jgi:hypothetical protein